MAPYNKENRPIQDKLNLNVKVHVERLINIGDFLTVYKSNPLKSRNVVGVDRNEVSKRVLSAKIHNDNPVNPDNCCAVKSPVVQTKNTNNNLRVRFLDNKVTKPARFKKDLRKRKTRDYAEISVCSPEHQSIKDESAKHIPIYLKQDVATKPNKRLKDRDPFEFVPETPRAYKRRLQKENYLYNLNGKYRTNSESARDSILYDKDTHDILKKLEAKEEAILRAKQNADKKLAKKKLLAKKQVNVKKNADTNNIVNNRLVNKIETNVTKVLSTSDEIDCCFGFDDDLEEECQAHKTRGTRNIQLKPTSKSTKKTSPEQFVALTATPVLKRRRSGRNNHTDVGNKVHIISNIIISPTSQVLRNKNLTTNKLAKIQPNNSIIRQSHARFPSLKQIIPSAATSTPQNQQRFGDFRKPLLIQNSPWRSDTANVSRNPHFLTMKNTSLPSYNQEMIMGPKLLEPPHLLKTPLRNDEKCFSQSSLLDFVNEGFNKSKTPSKTVLEHSLFDIGEFSPIKSSKKDKPPVNSPAKAKRNVFGVLQSPNRQSTPNLDNTFDVDNYFGFNSFNENDENKENRIKSKKKKHQVKIQAQPTRILLKDAKNLQQEIINDIEENLEYVDARVQDFPEEQDSDAPQVGLFEDLEVRKQPRRSYERKRPRRVRFKSVDSNDSEEIIKPKVKRKDVRTPAEEEEFNKWVKQFNAMCEEVDNHTLETD